MSGRKPMEPQPPVDLPGRVKHGSYTAWQKYRCRCEKCLHHMRTTNKATQVRRASKPVPEDVPHGRLSTYNYYACRCDKCKEARYAYDRERYELIVRGVW